MIRYTPKNRYAPDQQLPDQAASSMSVKGEDQVDYASQDDEPSNDRVDRHGGEKWRTDRQHAEDNQQNAPHD
jgi:hypothetical protein